MKNAAPQQEKPLRYIQRLDAGHHAWKVAFRRKNVAWHKYFPDSAYGDAPQALVAAIAWRDKMLAELSSADYGIWRRNLMPPTNTTGIVGVYRGMNTQKSAGRLITWPYWQAYWSKADGRRGQKTFSVSKYGEEGALELARQAREAGLADVAHELRSRAITANPASPSAAVKSRSRIGKAKTAR